MNNVELIKFSKINVGKLMKNSKIKFTWTIRINGDIYSIDFYDSKISGKFRIFINDEVYKFVNKSTNNSFEENLLIKENIIKLKKSWNNIEFFINNIKIDYEHISPNKLNNPIEDNNIFITSFNIDYSKNISEYITKKEIEIEEKPDYYYV